MAEVTNGARLVQLLKESGTGEQKLSLLREELRRVYAETGQIASAEHLITFMAGDDEGRPGHNYFSLDTVKKARRIAKTGSADVQVLSDLSEPIEERLLRESSESPAKSVGPRDVGGPPPDMDKLGKTFGPPAGPVTSDTSGREPVAVPRSGEKGEPAAENAGKAAEPTKGKADPFDAHAGKGKK